MFKMELGSWLVLAAGEMGAKYALGSPGLGILTLGIADDIGPAARLISRRMLAPTQSSSWGRFHESVSAVIFGKN
jgi:hypothetical protein